MRRPGLAIQLAFCGVLGANILTMALMNFLEAPTRDLLYVYFLCLVVTIAVMWKLAPELPKLTRQQHWMCVGFALAIFLPRWSYLVEGIFGYAVNFVCYDDTLHLQEMASIIHTPAFPPRSTIDNAQYLSYYYAPWMLGAALYETGLLVTVKQALGLTVLVYDLFFSYGVMYVSRIVYRDQRLQNVFLSVCVLYGGFDFVYWLSGLSLAPSHSEWWAEEFGFGVQYSNFFTLVLWVQQHTLAAFAVIYALFITHRCPSFLAAVAAGIFFLSAFFSSIFVSIGAAVLVLWYYTRYRRPKQTVITALTFLVVSVPLWWILLGKSGAVGPRLFGELLPFWQDHKRAAFVVFLLVLSLELMPLLAASFLSIRRDRSPSRSSLFWLCVLFLLSTFFVAFTVGNNYAMRGSIIPIFTLIYLATPLLSEWLEQVRTTPLRTVAAAYLLGGVLEYSSFWRMSLIAFLHSNSGLHADILHFNEGSSQVNGANLANRAENEELGWYLLERDRPRKRNIDESDLATMGADNRFRVSISTLNDLYSRLTQATTGSERTQSSHNSTGF